MLFRKNIERACSYCAHGGKVDEDTVLCRKKGFVAACSGCRRFRYDPLKRIPRRQRPQDFSRYDDREFTL